MTTTITYTAPRTLSRFLNSDSFVRCIVGPVGSGKSSVCVMELLARAMGQAAGPDGVRRTRFAVIRNTYSQLRDTTRKTVEQWIPQSWGTWNEQAFSFTMNGPAPDGTKIHCEILFRALDRPEDVKKLLSLELTGAYINESREVPKHVLDVLETRVGRYPSRAQGGATWFGIWMDTNPWHSGHWGAKLFARQLDGYSLFRQPGGRTKGAENIGNLPPGYYDRLCVGKDREWVSVYVDGEDSSGEHGSIFGAWIATVETGKRVAAFDHPMDGVHTAWDLGKSDSTAIWFWRVNHERHVDVLDYYEGTGQGLSHYFGVLESKKYKYEHHWLPHDAKVETLATQQSVIEQCRERFGIRNVDLVPDIGVDDGIGAARWLLETPMRFHERCTVPVSNDRSGLEVLREYRFEWDETNQVFSKTPLHNYASHGADAFRYLAVVSKHVETMTRSPAPKPRAAGATLAQMFEDQERRDSL